MADRSKSSAENVERKLSRDGLKRSLDREGEVALSLRPWLSKSRIRSYTRRDLHACTCILINFTEKTLGRFIKSDNKGDVEIRPIKWDSPMWSVCCKIQTAEN